ncbi:MAG TPA: triphosphoribosyl-dephospho-CoA synthase [Methanocorpusculum sp.]|nr:triphosphoribosyl-dephospho-CoA synthase [Methanocorpusculum sp.]
MSSAKNNLSPAEAAEFAMLLEVTAKCKPGNVDRFHDYDDTNLSHFLSSASRARVVIDHIDEMPLGRAFYDAVDRTNNHSGGNTHFGAFILLLPLVKGRGIAGAQAVVKKTDVEDAVLFYKAFGLTQVRTNKESEMDVNDPASIQMLYDKKMTMLNVMEMSAPNDMVAREWTNGFALTREFADMLKETGGASKISEVFLKMMARHADTFIAKKFDAQTADSVKTLAQNAASGKTSPETFDAFCLKEGINPGSLADICIAGIFTALMEGWNWDC